MLLQYFINRSEGSISFKYTFIKKNLLKHDSTILIDIIEKDGIF